MVFCNAGNLTSEPTEMLAEVTGPHLKMAFYGQLHLDAVILFLLVYATF